MDPLLPVGEALHAIETGVDRLAKLVKNKVKHVCLSSCCFFTDFSGFDDLQCFTDYMIILRRMHHEQSFRLNRVCATVPCRSGVTAGCRIQSRNSFCDEAPSDRLACGLRTHTAPEMRAMASLSSRLAHTFDQDFAKSAEACVFRLIKETG